MHLFGINRYRCEQQEYPDRTLTGTYQHGYDQ